MQFVPYDTSVEVSGDALRIFIEMLKIHNPAALQILEKHGLKDLKSGEWYPQKTWLDAFKEISTNLGPTILYLLGTKLPENTKWFSGVDNLQKGLLTINEKHHTSHRNGKTGDYSLVAFDPEKRQAKIVCDTPYPCDFERGIIAYVLMHFNRDDPRKLWVVHENPYECRKRDANSCTYIVRW